MKPSDLKIPFSFSESRVLLQDRVLFVPSRIDYTSFKMPDWEEESVFGNRQPVKIEFCSGNGDWINQRALQDKESNWVAIEKRFDRSRRIWSKSRNLSLPNLFLIWGEALTVCVHYLKASSVDEIFINFPDPWPKHRHAKNRLIDEIFVEQLHRILKPGGALTLVTDDENYAHQMLQKLKKNEGFKPFYPSPFYANEYPSYGTSYFDQLWRSRGKAIYFLKFINS